MSDKIKENEFDENSAAPKEAEVNHYIPGEEKYEENDNWEFEAKALTLENNDFVLESEAGGVKPEVKEEKKAPAVAVSEKKAPEIKSDKKKDKNIIKFICAGVLCAAIAAVLIFFGIRFFTVPNTNEKMNPGNVAVTIDKTDVSIGMYNYYYNAVTNNYKSYAQQGYYQIDLTKDFSKQKTTDADGNEITWADLFVKDTLDRIQYITAYYQEAAEHGVTLTETQKTEIEENIKSIKEEAAKQNKSIDEYISETYGEYCGIATIRKLLNQSYIANNYYRQHLIENKVDDKDIKAYFDKHKDDYTQIDFAYLPVVFTAGDSKSQAQAEKSAKKYAGKIKNIKDLKKAIPTVCKTLIDEYVAAGQFESAEDCAETIASSVENSITKSDKSFTEAASNWLFDEKTKVNDCAYFLDEENSLYFIVLKTGKPEIAEDEVYSVRHILITPQSKDSSDSDSEEQTTQKKYTKKEWAAAEKKAEKILDEYKKGDKTEYSFALLAEKYSDDTESTSKGTSGLYGGLYEGTPLGRMVKNFEEWSTDKKRKYGDTDIVKSDFGYHIIFFVEDTTSSLFKSKIAVQTEKENEYIKSFEIKKHSGAMKKTTVAKPEKADETTTQAAAE
ncbi:MAG: peptidylprolyl isomerase [Eubacterium sp.]|nr:peptidylprolyl isomerase [Eubacterium sp.]